MMLTGVVDGMELLPAGNYGAGSGFSRNLHACAKDRANAQAMPLRRRDISPFPAISPRDLTGSAPWRLLICRARVLQILMQFALQDIGQLTDPRATAYRERD
jgi:hypothetical protein